MKQPNYSQIETEAILTLQILEVLKSSFDPHDIETVWISVAIKEIDHVLKRVKSYNEKVIQNETTNS